MANDDINDALLAEDIQNIFLIRNDVTCDVTLIYMARQKMAIVIENPNNPESVERISNLKERGARIVSSEELDGILDPRGENRLPSAIERRIARRLEERRKRKRPTD